MVSNAASAVRPRRRLSVEDRRNELLEACLELIGARPWDEVSMAEVAVAAGVSKPLLYHYFSTKSALYLATVSAAADDLRASTRLDLSLPADRRMRAALEAFLAWIDDHAASYRAILQGGRSSDVEVEAIVERSRAEVIDQLTATFHLADPSPTQVIAFRGWVGFLESASLEWLTSKAITRAQLADLLVASLTSLSTTFVR